jgi:pimeloyl-ACP methyl ester carboxylesterase
MVAHAAPATHDVSARGGARIRFVEAGRGTALVLIHDALGDHHTFERALDRLSASFHVVVPDLPGFGASEKPDPVRYAYGYDAFAEAIFDLVAALGLGRVHLCGHGMGGGVALTLAAKHPSLVHRLVLSSPLVFPIDDRREHTLDRLARIPLLGGFVWRQVVGTSLFRSYIEGAMYAGAARPRPERALALYENFNAPAARQAAHATIAAKADTRALVARLPRVSADTLVLWGRDDRLAPIEHGRRLARELRGRFEVLECGRSAPDEVPDVFASTLLGFLETRAAETRSHL